LGAFVVGGFCCWVLLLLGAFVGYVESFWCWGLLLLGSSVVGGICCWVILLLGSIVVRGFGGHVGSFCWLCWELLVVMLGAFVLLTKAFRPKF